LSPTRSLQAVGGSPRMRADKPLHNPHHTLQTFTNL
jgi:hypothetical protein